ncbi:MAG: hypothetical protein RL695_1367, partial [Pseudomonadota bacterium]|jgi:hypothetical protein
LRQEIEAHETAHEHERLHLLFRIRMMLADWQINHTTKSDLHLGHFLQRAGVS